jgi:hypothetical protein
MLESMNRTRIKIFILAASLVGVGSLSVHAQGQDPDYVLWVESDRADDRCSENETVTFRVFLEIKEGSAGVIAWDFGVCHDPDLLLFRSATAGSATRGTCNGEDAAVADVLPSSLGDGFTMKAVLPGAAGFCSLPPGCPYELAVAQYVCNTELEGLKELTCLCDSLQDGVILLLETQEVVVPTQLCEPHSCDNQPPPTTTCDCTATDFWLAFPGNLALDPDATRNPTLIIQSETAARVTIEIPDLNFTQIHFLAANTAKQVSVPRAVELGFVSDAIEKKGIHVFSDEPVQVQGVNNVQYAVDGFLALPTELLGTEHLVLGYRNVHPEPRVINGSQFAIVAVTDETTVVITPTVDTDGHPAGVPYALTLNRADTYQLTNLDSGSDLTGTEILSDRPIAVFGSHRCATLPGADTFFCNHLVEQLPPTRGWGTSFLSVPLRTRAGGDVFRFLAQAAGTAVSINGVLAAVLNRGEFKEVVIAGGAHITSDLPILVAQYSQGSWVDGNDLSDPSMVLVQPTGSFRDHYLVTTPEAWFEDLNFVHLVVPDWGVGSIFLDGVPIPAAQYNPIPASAYSGARVPISKGMTHQLTGFAAVAGGAVPGVAVPFGAFVYGFDLFDAYSFPACFGRSSQTDPVGNDLPGGGLCGLNQLVPQGKPLSVSPFIRGDVNVSGVVDVSDGISILLHLFADGRLDCLEAADVNESSAVDLSDGVAVFSHLFQSGARPPMPYPVCGLPQRVLLGCAEFLACDRE